VLFGLIKEHCTFKAFDMLGGYKKIGTSNIGSVQRCRELINLCDQNQI